MGREANYFPTNFQPVMLLWCSSTHKWQTALYTYVSCTAAWIGQSKNNNRRSELRSCRRERAQCPRSPSPAPSPGWRGPPCSAGFPRWRTRTSSPACCCSSCSWRPAPCVSPSAWPCPGPRCAADSQPGGRQSVTRLSLVTFQESLGFPKQITAS